MKEVNGIVNGTIKMISSAVVAEIISKSGYFEEVRDISNQLNADNTMVFDLYVDISTILGESDYGGLDNIDTSFDEEEGLSEIINIYMDLALEDIISMVREHINVINITGSFSTNQMDGGINALIYLYFGEYFLNEDSFH